MTEEVANMDVGINFSVHNGALKDVMKQVDQLQAKIDEALNGTKPSRDPFSPTRKSSNATAKALQRQAEASRKAAVQASAYGQASARAAASATKLKGVSTQWDQIARSSRAASVASAAAIGASVKGAMTLQDSFKRTNNLLVTGGEKASEAQRNVNKMQKDGATYSKKYGVSQKSIADGYQELVKRGYDSNQALGAQKSLLQASIASGDSYADVVHNSTTALESFGMRSKTTAGMITNTKKVVNEMAYASDLTATDFHSMGKAMEYVGSTAHLSGLSLHETASAIGILSNNGLEADKAGTGLRKSLTSLQSPGKAAVAALDSINLKSTDFAGKNGKMKSMSDTFGLLNRHMKGLSQYDKADLFHDIFGATGQQAATILADNVTQLKALDKQVEKSPKNNYVEKLANKNMTSALAQWKRFKETIKAVGLSLGSTFLPAVNDTLKGLAKLADKLSEMPEAGKKAVAFGTMTVAALYPVAKVVSTITGAIGSIQTLRSGKLAKVAENTVMPAVPLSAKPKIAGQVVGPTTVAEMGAGIGGARGGTSGKLSSLGSRAKTSMGKLSGAASTVLGTTATEKVLNGAALAGIGVEIGGKVVSAIHDGVDTKRGGKELWQGAGSAVAGGLGLALSGGNPVVAMIASSVGGAIAGKIADSQVVKDLNQKGKKSVKNYTKKRKKTDPTYQQMISGGGGVPSLQDPTDPANYTKPKSSSKRKTSKKGSDPLKGLSKENKSFVKDTQKLLKDANKNYLSIMATGSKSVLKKNKETYSDLTSSATDYQKKQNKNVEYLRKMGAISDLAANKEESGGKKRVDAVKATIAKIERAEKSGNSNRSTLIAKLNRQLLQLTSTGAKKQRDILSKLHTGETALTTKQYKSVMKQSKKAYSTTLKDAKKSYNGQVSSADKTYKKTLKAAADVYGVRSKEYAKIKKTAEKQREKTTDAAYDQYKKVVKYANKQRDATVQAAADAAGGVMGIMGVLSTNLQDFIDSPNALSIGAQQPTKHKKNGLTNSIVSGDNTTFNPGATLSNASHAMPGPSTTKKLPTTTSSAKPKIKVTKGFAVGSGGRYPNGLPKQTSAVVNDGTGPEAIILSGRNRHVILPKGAHVLNARDTQAKYGPQHFAGGTTHLKSGKVEGIKVSTPNGSLKKTESSTKKSMGSITKSITSGYTKSNKQSTKQLTSMRSKSAKTLKGLNSDAKSYTQKFQKTTVGNFDDTQKGAVTQMKQMRKDVNAYNKVIDSDFDNAMGKLPGYAQSGIKGAITSLNRGMAGVNTALSQFGGSKNVLKMAHYAEGSRGPISRDQLAVVNDATSGPRQEAIIRDKQVLFPHGRDTVVPLQKGDHVINGRDVQQAFGNLPHYKKGTESLRNLIEKNNKDPKAAFKSEFDSNLGKGISTTVGQAANQNSKGGADSVGNPWSGAVWKAFSNAMSGSGAGGNWAHTPGLAESNGFNASRGSGVHDGVDFSGPIGSAFKAVHGGTVIRTGGSNPWHDFKDLGNIIEVKSDDGFHEIYQEFGPMSSIGVNVGDQVKTGQTLGHLGHLAGHDVHVHVGVSKDPWHSNGYGHAGWYDVTKMKGSSSGLSKSKSSNKDSALDKYVKKQLAGQIKWIGKNLSEDDAGSLGSLGLSGSISAKAQTLAAALKKIYPSATNAGIAAVLGNWQFESHLDPTAINPGGGASGLGQWLGGRKANLISYARAHHQNWKNAGTQLDFALHGDGSDSNVLKRILRGTGSVASLAAAFSSQWERGGYTAQHVAGARTIASVLQGREHGGPVQKGKTYKVHEKGFELFKPNVDGKVEPHDKALKSVNGSGRGNVTIEQNIVVHAEGNQDAKITKQVKQGTAEANSKMIEKLVELWGFNDEGGFVI